MTILAVCGPIGCDLKAFSDACYQQLNNEKALLIDSSVFLTQDLLETFLKETNEDVIVFGSNIFLEAPLRELFDIKVFLELDSDLCLSYFVQANLQNIDDILERYLNVIKPSNERIRYSSKWADLILPQSSSPEKAINLLINAKESRINKVSDYEDNPSSAFQLS